MDLGWSSGLCECCQRPEICCTAFCCPCVVIYWNVKKMKELEKVIPICKICPGCMPECAGICYAFGWVSGLIVGNTPSIREFYGVNMLGGLSVFLHATIRNKIRTDIGIKSENTRNPCDSVLGDCCCACFCHSCAMTQEYAELHWVPPRPTTDNPNSMMKDIKMVYPPRNVTSQP